MSENRQYINIFTRAKSFKKSCNYAQHDFYELSIVFTLYEKPDRVYMKQFGLIAYQQLK